MKVVLALQWLACPLDLGFHFQSNFRIYCAENVGHANKGGEDRHNPVTTLFFNLDDGVLLYKNIVICVFIFFFGFRSNSFVGLNQTT